MEKRITLTKARHEFCAIVRDVYINNAVYTITHHQKKVATLRQHDEWRKITINKTEKQIEKLVSQISDLLKQFY